VPNCCGGTGHELRRRQFLHLAAGAAALPAASRFAWAQTYPSRPVRIFVGFPASATPDLVARLVGQTLSERIGQPLVIENRPGAAGNIATEAVVRATPDGYTLLLANGANAISAALYEKLSFDFIRDIAPVASIGSAALVLVTNPSFPATTVPEFIAYAKAHPGQINVASVGVGASTPFLACELFKAMTGVDLVHVAYRSSYMPDLMTGQVQAAFPVVPSSLEYIRTGKVRAIAVTSTTHLEQLPGLPTIDESVPGYEASSWFGVGAPKGTSTTIIEKLNREIDAIVADPNMRARLVALGLQPMSLRSAEFGKFIAAQIDKWAKVIKSAGIKPE
jgi:tripartite-type tricarboxylate transporter receptor subunit TctC